jgi:putative pyruvate formate lyase activating enzyme
MTDLISDFEMPIADCEIDSPSYLRLLETGQLQRRVEALEALLERCTVCPLDCGNNRLAGDLARCYSGRLPVVSSYTPHFGEEPPLTGTRGAGNVFFGNCKPALRLLSELSDFTGAQRTDQK